MIPLKDLNPHRTFPFVNYIIIAANVLVFFYQLSLGTYGGQQFVMTYGMVPARLQVALTSPNVSLLDGLVPLFTSMFLHGGWLHIIGNMWFLFIFGDNIEDELGHFQYALFYLLCGLASGLAQTIFTWGSKLPAIGASGAIAGVLGAYAIFFPRSQVLTLIPLVFFFFTVKLPSLFFIGFWFLIQFLSGVGSLQTGASGGTAWWAHVGGFLFGILLVKTWMAPQRWPAAYS